MATAKSLAAGTGYRHIELPGQPWQTKYPILYPAVLAGAFLLCQEYPQNLGLLMLPGALAAAAFVTLSVSYLRTVLHVSRRTAAVVAILAALSPAILSLVRFTMSDIPYAALAAEALLCLDGKYEPEAATRRRWKWLLAAGLLIAAGMHTRGVGVALALAAVVSLLVRRRLKDAAVLCGVIALCMAPWWFFQAWAARANGDVQNSLLFAGDLRYGLWMPHQLSDTLRVMWHNLFEIVFCLTQYEFAFPWALLFSWSAESSWVAILAHDLAYTIAIVVLIGFIQSVRSGWRVMHVYALCYGLLILAWPFEPSRFLTVWSPWLIFFFLLGTQQVSDFLGRFFASPLWRRWVFAAVVTAPAVTLLVLFVGDDISLLVSTGTGYYFQREFSEDRPEREEAIEYLRSCTSAADVVASTESAGLFLATGRRGVGLWHDNDPYELYYGSDRQWCQFYYHGTESEQELQYRQMTRELPKAYQQAGVTYLLMDTNDTLFALWRYVGEHKSWFHLRHKSPKGMYSVYQVQPGAWQPAARPSTAQVPRPDCVRGLSQFSYQRKWDCPFDRGKGPLTRKSKLARRPHFFQVGVCSHW